MITNRLKLIINVYIYSVLTFLTVPASADENSKSIVIPPARSAYDISHEYHTILLSQALRHSDPDKTYSFTNSQAMSQGRAQAELIKGNELDVYWFGTNISLENKLRPIKIPTTRGLNGYRKFIIHDKNVPVFNNINRLSDLSKLVACQGAHWPDTKILTNAGLPVTTSTSYENLFLMTNLERCDYFPRGYHDAANELTIRRNQYPSLITYQRILLHYPFAVYFFTNKKQEALAKKIENGLQIMAEKGEITTLMKTHPLTKSIYPLKDESNSLYLRLENPLLTDTDVTNNIYWIQPEDFQIEPQIE